MEKEREWEGLRQRETETKTERERGVFFLFFFFLFCHPVLAQKGNASLKQEKHIIRAAVLSGAHSAAKSRNPREVASRLPRQEGTGMASR